MNAISTMSSAIQSLCAADRAATRHDRTEELEHVVDAMFSFSKLEKLPDSEWECGYVQSLSTLTSNICQCSSNTDRAARYFTLIQDLKQNPRFL